MSLTFEGIYVPGIAADALLQAVEERLDVLAAKRLEPEQPAGDGVAVTLGVHRGEGGVAELVGLQPRQGEVLGGPLSAALGKPTLVAGVLEGDVWYYHLFVEGERQSGFVSISELLGEPDESPSPDPARLAAVWPGADPGVIQSLIDAQSAHAEALLEEFLEHLGVPGAFEAPAQSVQRLRIEVPRIDEDELSVEEQEEAVKAMFDALGVDQTRSEDFMGFMRKLEGFAAREGIPEGGEGLDPSQLADLERRLSADDEFRKLAGELTTMRTDLMDAFEKTVEGAQGDDPELREVLSRADKAARVETQLLQFQAFFDRNPKDGIRLTSELFCQVVEEALGEQDFDAGRHGAVQVDSLLGRVRREAPALARDLYETLPVLASCHLAHCLLSRDGVDLVRRPAAREFRLRRGSVEVDPAAMVRAAMSRRAPEPLEPAVDRFLGLD